MGRRKTNRNEEETALPAKDLLAAMKGIYADRVVTREVKVGLPAPEPALAQKEFGIPQAMAGLIDEYIGFVIVANGHALNDHTKRNFSDQIATELFRIAISSDKSFEKYLQDKPALVDGVGVG